MLIDFVPILAAICHEVNAAYCKTLGDFSQPPWANAPGWQKKSALEGVQAALGDPEWTPEKSHEQWMRQKEAEGWTYGLNKDAEAKTHPCMLPYDKLPQSQRVKDHLFLAVVQGYLAAVPADSAFVEPT